MLPWVVYPDLSLDLSMPMHTPSKPDPLLALLETPSGRLTEAFAHLPAYASPLDVTSTRDSMATVLDQVADRLADNYPYTHPLYAGQMLKPPHPIARAAYALAMTINPNNHALDGGRASSRMEIEAVAELAQMFGFQTHLGHLTSSGTIANLEALWVAGQLNPGKLILASDQAHYTHQRISGVLQLPFQKVASNQNGCMDLNALEDQLRTGNVGTVVATLGTTALGSVDPLPEILALRDKYGFRVHVDAAYGGYFRLIADQLAPPARAAYDAMQHADSIVVDPHKHGLQPYGCGCVLFRDPSVGRLYKHDSPYTYFTSGELHLGEISLECSRVPNGEFAQNLAASRRAALELDRRLRADSRFLSPLSPPQLDIVVWQAQAETQPSRSARAQQIFDRCATQHLHLALAQLPELLFQSNPQASSEPHTTCLRSVLMKPEHADWLDAIWQRLDSAAN
jgi:glutamate/tyrosine decarboxylase-like PLP-dependent enzyme